MKKMKHGGKVHKRMMDGGMAMPTRGTMPNERGPMTRPGSPVRGGGGVPLQGPGRDDQARIVRNPVDQESRAVNLANKRAQKAYYSQVSAPYRTPGRYGGADRMVRPGVMGGPPPASAPQAPAKSGSIYGSRAADMASGRGPGRVGRGMRGGGLARKGVGMALAKGGLARRAGGCAKRGVGKGKIL